MLVAAGLSSCGPVNPDSSGVGTRTVYLGSFEGEVDPVVGTVRIWNPAAPISGFSPGAAIIQLPEGSGAGGYVTVANVAGTVNLNVLNGCSAGVNSTEATVRVTSAYPAGSYLRNVYAQINRMDGTGVAGCNSAQSFPSGSGLSNAKGLWAYDPINPAASADAVWKFSRPAATAYRFGGAIYGEVVTQTVPTDTTVAITNPTAIAYDTQNLWVAGAGATSQLFAFSPALVQKAGSPYSMANNTATLLPTAAVTSQSNNNIWVTSADTVSHTSMIQNFAVNNGSASSPITAASAEFVAIANDTVRNNVFAADQFGNKAYVYDAPNSKLQTTLTQAAPNNIGTTPVALVFDGASMWVANSGSNDITVIVTTGSGGGQTFTGTKYTTGTRPVALAYDGSTYVWVANQAAFTVTRHTKAAPGTTSTFSVTNQPDDIAIDATGNVWVLSKNARVLTKLDSGGNFVAAYALTFQPTKVRFFGGFLWIGDASGSVLVRWTG